MQRANGFPAVVPWTCTAKVDPQAVPNRFQLHDLVLAAVESERLIVD